MLTAVDVVREYTNAFAARNVERMIALADPEIEIVTPRGTGRGHQQIRDFMQRQTYGVAMHSELVRVLHRGETVVTEEQVELRYVETGERAEAFTVASVYVVREGRVVRLAPQSDFEAAAREAGLTRSERRSRGDAAGGDASAGRAAGSVSPLARSACARTVTPNTR